MIEVSFVEEMILNYDALPKQFKGWRRYRIEYLSDDAIYQIHEDTIYLPPTCDAFELEYYINRMMKNA